MQKSCKQKAAELKIRRAGRKLERLATTPAVNRVWVDPAFLEADNNYGLPAFAERGFYVDQTFECRDCRKREVWTATQQKWWYEIVKGGLFTVAHRCRPCRRKERDRIAEHSRASEAGRKRKARLKAEGLWRRGL